MPHHPLQLVAGELLHQAARRHDHGFVRRMSRDQGVHGVVIGKQVDGRDRDT
jgi:hypothetical protein